MTDLLEYLGQLPLLRHCTSAQLGAVLFISFVAATVVAFVASSRPLVRRTYLACFFVAFIVPGFAGGNYWFWPFQTWHLWGGLQGRQGEFHELLLGDAAGNLYIFDRRAIPPLLDTQVHQLARHLIAGPQDAQALALATFLLEHANALRSRLLVGTSDGFFPAYPEREYGRNWSQQELAMSQPFVRVVARRVSFHFNAGLDTTTSILDERTLP